MCRTITTLSAFLSSALAIAVATSAVCAEDPAPTGQNDLGFFYQAPLAYAGMIEVYMTTGGKYARTTPFRLQGYELQDEGKRLAAKLNLEMTKDDQSLL